MDHGSGNMIMRPNGSSYNNVSKVDNPHGAIGDRNPPHGQRVHHDSERPNSEGGDHHRSPEPVHQSSNRNDQRARTGMDGVQRPTFVNGRSSNATQVTRNGYQSNPSAVRAAGVHQKVNQTADQQKAVSAWATNWDAKQFDADRAKEVAAGNAKVMASAEDFDTDIVLRHRYEESDLEEGDVMAVRWDKRISPTNASGSTTRSSAPKPGSNLLLDQDGLPILNWTVVLPHEKDKYLLKHKDEWITKAVNLGLYPSMYHHVVGFHCSY